MSGFNFNQAFTTTILVGFILFVILTICLLAAGFTDHDIGRVWAALAVVWAPAAFIWGGRSPEE